MSRTIRKNKKRLFVYLDAQLHDEARKRAEFRNISITDWIIIALGERIDKENKYL